MSEQSNKIRIIAVHGTWGRGFFNTYKTARWCSSFCEQLELQIGRRFPNVEILVDHFIWSGSNSIYERSSAAAELIRKLNVRHDFDLSVVIGHSHGGNIGLLALTGDNHAEGEHYLITLATPFVRVFSTDVAKDVWYKLPATWVAGLAIVLVMLGFAPWLAGNGSILLVPFIAAGLLIIFLKFFPALKQIKRVKEAKRDRLVRETAVDASKLNGRMLVVRGVDDEASLVLAAGSLAARVGQWLKSKTGFAVMFVPVFLFVFSSLNAIETLAMANAPMSMVFVLPILSAYMLLILPFLAPLFRGVFGPELFFLSAGCQVAVDSAPDGEHMTTLTIASEEQIGLRGWSHFIYDHPKCVTVTAVWLSDKLKGDGTSDCIEQR